MHRLKHFTVNGKKMSNNHESMELQLEFLDLAHLRVKLEQAIANDKIRLAKRLWYGWLIATFGSIIISTAFSLFSTSTCT